MRYEVRTSQSLGIRELLEACDWCREHAPSCSGTLIDGNERFLQSAIDHLLPQDIDDLVAELVFTFDDLVEATHFKLRWG